MTIPQYTLLADGTARGRLADLRSAVTPCLAGNYLPSFTDHSVDHSNRLCDLVDRLAEPLPQACRLSDTEAFVVYAACYLHDVGLQHQRAYHTQVVQAILQRPEYGGRQWDKLNIETQRNIVRAEHHHISGELIRQSVDAPQPTPLGIQLTQDWHPGEIASLCVAHCLDTAMSEYTARTQDSGAVRMSLLSALLRIADILDESRPRSKLYLECTRELSLESKMHWWRHYYVADITVDSPTRQIILWFDFPPDRRTQYREMIPPLQVPWIQAEFARHDAVLARNSLHWYFRLDEIPAAHSTARAMENDLERYILEKLAVQREQQAERDRLLLLDQLKVARPTIERSLIDLRSRAPSMSPDQQLAEFCEIAKHLWNLGGRRDAWTTLSSEYNKLSAAAAPAVRLDIALELAEMMLKDGCTWYAIDLLCPMREQAKMLPDVDPLKYRFATLLGRSYLDHCAYAEGIAELSLAVQLAPNDAWRSEVEAELEEARLLQGEIDHPTTSPGAGEA